MNILFTICGRAGSKGIKNKNIKPFLGIYLPVYTLAVIDLFLKKYPNINGTIAVNTDSKELVDILLSNPWCQIECIERKMDLAGDDVSKVDVIRDTWRQVESVRGIVYDVVVDLDITSPLRTLKDLENLIHEYKKNRCDVVYSVTESRRNPYFNMVMALEGGYQRVITSDFVTRQATPEVYDMNASLYAYNPQFLNSQKGLFEGIGQIIKMMDTGILDLDHEHDFELMEVIAKYLFGRYPEFDEVNKHSREYLDGEGKSSCKN